METDYADYYRMLILCIYLVFRWVSGVAGCWRIAMPIFDQNHDRGDHRDKELKRT